MTKKLKPSAFALSRKRDAEEILKKIEGKTGRLADTARAEAEKALAYFRKVYGPEA